MTAIDILELAPKEERVYEDGDLVGEMFRDENACEEQAPFYIVRLTDDPNGPTRIYAREQLHETAQWTVDARPGW